VPAKIIIVDDEERMASVIAMALRRAGHECLTFDCAEDALSSANDGADVMITDLKMPGMDGIQLLRRLRAQGLSIPVILITAHGSVASAVDAMREGAFDYIAKPFDNEELRSLVARALEMRRLERENRHLRAEVGRRYAPDEFTAESAQSKTLLELLQRVAPSRATVLIQGESGTGKELVARILHYWSERVGQPFLPVNCKAFAAGVLESELFGHEKGAFTGAVAARPGCFERADGGTLFLDEIGDIEADFQAKLLRVLQEGEVLRVGGTQPRRVDVRVIAATNRNLREEVSTGRFREDLFFRLNVIPIFLAPLGERREDILPLAHRFLERYSRDEGRTRTLSAESEAALLAHPWRGNVRELQNAIERAVVLSRDMKITPGDLLLEQASDRPREQMAETLQEHLDEAAASRIRAALQETGDNRLEAARLLGIERTTLYRMMKRLGI
jgi:DNA-binding NtrC family response regulator